ncbi:hypothetical protein DKT69_34130 [Micromonospora sicca]|uniref:Uncharacterized protein n=1 Tax=Micromonospora sicca TaxID=2202420 RepID=A0A317CZA8_9ACTN|nr:hypothetical protein DKT69_34130 [Micromonospora sp. 4G51]
MGYADLGDEGVEEGAEEGLRGLVLDSGVRPAGASRCAARISAVLNDASRRLPEMARTETDLVCLLVRMPHATA